MSDMQFTRERDGAVSRSELLQSPIGPSTGWLSAKIGTDLATQEAVLSETPASAAEMVWEDGARRRAMLSRALEVELVYKSLHLGSFTDFGVSLTPEQRDLVSDIARIWNAHGLVGSSAHPDQTPAHMYGILREAGITVAIENMDRKKSVGRTIQEVDLLIARHQTPGVLDLQHAYELSVDSGVSFNEVVERLTAAMAGFGGITHLHVSGELSEDGAQLVPHVQLTVATNREAILSALDIALHAAGRPLPIILEGDPLPEVSFLSHSGPIRKRMVATRTRQAIESISKEIELVAEAFPERLRLPG